MREVSVIIISHIQSIIHLIPVVSLSTRQIPSPRIGRGAGVRADPNTTGIITYHGSGPIRHSTFQTAGIVQIVETGTIPFADGRGT